jgi:hypothetical protein
MKISFTNNYVITFQVSYFEGTEGGMDTGDYGSPVETIEEAILLLELAKRSSKDDWKIVVKTINEIS